MKLCDQAEEGVKDHFVCTIYRLVDGPPTIPVFWSLPSLPYFAFKKVDSTCDVGFVSSQAPGYTYGLL